MRRKELSDKRQQQQEQVAKKETVIEITRDAKESAQTSSKNWLNFNFLGTPKVGPKNEKPTKDDELQDVCCIS